VRIGVKRRLGYEGKIDEGRAPVEDRRAEDDLPVAQDAIAG
jgi:hypothetical protein